MADDLERFLEHKPIHARPVGVPERLLKWSRRNRALAAALGIVVLAVLATIITLGVANARITASHGAAVRAEADERAAKDQALDLADQRDRLAKSERSQRIVAQRRTRIADSYRLAAESQIVLKDHPQRSLLLAVEAVEITRRTDETVQPAARKALLTALSHTGGRVLRPPSVGTALRQLDPKWRTQILDFLDPEDIRNLFDDSDLGEGVTGVNAADPSARFELKEQMLDLVAVGPRGRWVAAAQTYEQKEWDVTLPVVHVWDLFNEGQEASPHVLVGPSSTVNAIDTSGDGRWLAAASRDGKLYLWSLGEGLQHEPQFTYGIREQDPDAKLQITSVAARAVAFSGDGRFLATAWRDGRVRLWRMSERGPDGEPIRLLSLGSDVLSPILEFSRNGRWLATVPEPYNAIQVLSREPDGGQAGVDGPTIRLYDLSTISHDAQPILVHVGREDMVSMALSNEGDRLAVGCKGGHALVWSLGADGAVGEPVILRRQAHWTESALRNPHELGRVAFLADSRWLVTLGDHGAQFWDLDDDDSESSFPPLRAVTKMICDPQGRWLASYGRSASHITLYDPLTLTAILGTRKTVPYGSGPYGPGFLEVIGDDRTKVICAKRTDGRAVTDAITLFGHEGDVIALAASDDGNQLVSSSLDGTLRVWPVVRGEPFAVPGCISTCSMIDDLVLTNDGTTLFTAEVVPRASRETSIKGTSPGTNPVEKEPKKRSIIRRWNLGRYRDEPAATEAVDTGDDYSYGLAASADGRYLASVGCRTVRLWELSEGDSPKPLVERLLRTSDQSIWYRSCSVDAVNLIVDPQGRWWAFTLRPKSYNWWRARNGDQTRITHARLRHKLPDATSIRFWRLGRHATSDKPTLLGGHEDWITSMAVSSSGQFAATASADHTVRLWDMTAASPAKTVKVLHAHATTVSNVAFAPSGRWLASGDDDGVVLVWDITSDDLSEPRHKLKADAGMVDSLSFSPNDRWLATGHFRSGDRVRNHPRVWDLHAADPAASSIVLDDHSEESESFFTGFSPDGRWLVTSGRDSEPLVLWDMSGDNPGASFFKPLRTQGPGYHVVSNIAFSADGLKLISGGAEGLIRVWPLDVEEMLELARHTANRNLSSEERSRYLLLHPKKIEGQ